MKSSYPYHSSEIAIIGVAARFPGSDSVDEFWQNLCLQREGIRFFTEEELIAAGISESLLKDPGYVKAKGVVHDCNDFDAAFFSYSDREAGLMDPQLRVYHECAWHALEDAGYAGQKNNNELIGIFGGASANALWTAQYAQAAEQGGAAAYEIINVISRDFFNSRLAYKLNFKGPAVTVQTACSTALVAVHQAAQSLLSGDSDIALAGAVSLSLNPSLKEPEQQGYLYQEGMILSPDGHCRPFDQEAQGTVLSDGVGFVVLKRLQEAIDDGDHIYCIIKGSAINNDGNDKIGYTAPSVNGQREVLETALSVAGVEANTIGYVEAHGTGTNLGDPIEVQALLQAYRGFAEAPCYLGSVKSNLGHLDTAAGMAGLIKTMMTVKHGVIPATLHFSQLNKRCDFSVGQLQVAASNQVWHSDKPLRAAVSSFGIGGTNAHIILEEYVKPLKQPSVTPDWLVLPLSAKSEPSLHVYQQQLQRWLPTGQVLTDVAYTLTEKRARFDFRQGLVIDNKAAVVFSSAVGERKTAPNVYWMFSGQGTQYLQMGKGLYDSEPVFRSTLDECLRLINALSGPDIRDLLVGEDISEVATQRLNGTDITQLGLFVLEYSLARFLSALGIQPKGFIGHSLGEYVAACLAGVFSLADALKLVIARGRLMAKTAAGSMVVIHQNIQSLDLAPWPELSIAAINTEQNFVVSGAAFAITRFTEHLSTQAIHFTPLNTSHAFHSSLMDSILEEFVSALSEVQINPPQIAIMSNVTGDWVIPEIMATQRYWVSHLRQQVCFHQGLSRILHDKDAILLEVGPGKTLTAFARQHPARQAHQLVLNSLRGVKELESDTFALKRICAELYAQNVQMEWSVCNPVVGQICSLPGYAFNRKRYVPSFKGFNVNQALVSAEGFYKEQWERYEASDLLEPQTLASEDVILVLCAGVDNEQALLQQLVVRGVQLIEVTPGTSFQSLGQGRYQIRPDALEDYLLLGKEFIRAALSPAKVIQLWQASSNEFRYRPFAGLLLLTQAFSQLNFNAPMSIYAISEGTYRVTGDEQINADAALIYGPVRVIGQEYPHIRCHLMDIRQQSLMSQASILTHAIFSTGLPLLTAWRGDSLWIREFKALGENWQAKSIRQGFRHGGVYVITGGFGGLGSEIARYLAREYQAKVVLSSRKDQSNHPLLEELNMLGGKAISLQVDMRKKHSAEQLVDAALQNFGRVNGIIHAAGIPGETMIQRHELDKAINVIDTKLASATEMLALTKNYSLDILVFFSSVTGILGGVGQTDYCAANAGLDALAEQARVQGLSQVYSIRWDAWRETGMAVDALNGKLRTLERTDHPFIGDLISKTDSTSIFCNEVNVKNCWALDEHWVMGVPTIPGTTYIEMAGAAYTQQTGLQAKCFSDIYFVAPLSLAADETADLYTQLIKDGNSFSFEVGSYHRQRQQWQLHVRGNIHIEKELNSSIISIAKLQAQYQSRYLDKIEGAAHLGVLAMGVTLSQSEQDAMMKYGPRWAVVKEIWLGPEQGLARLQLQKRFQDDIVGMMLHPALLDCALSYLRAFLDAGVYIPISCQQFKQYKSLPAEFYSHIRLISVLKLHTGVMSFDIQLLSPNGELLADIREFTMRRIGADFVENNHSTRSMPIPHFVRQFRPMLQGLSTVTAITALENIVRSAHSLSLVSASDFAERHAHADEGDMGLFNPEQLSIQQVRPRPEISVEFVGPKTLEQQQLADIWGQMLGFERVGIQDDFFELGGDSLLLMQIHKKVQTLFNSNIPVVEFYNHPTIQRLTDYLNTHKGNEPDVTLVDISDRIEKQKAAAARRRRARQD